MTSPWNDGSVDCPICGACRSFTIDATNESRGYCDVEKITHEVKWDTVICGICGRETLRTLTVQRRNAAGRTEPICKRHCDTQRVKSFEEKLKG